MDDRLDDRFAEAVRDALTARVRAAEPQGRRVRDVPRRRRIELVWAGVVAAVAVVAIAVAGLSLAGLQRRAAPAAPAPSPPAQPFRGDCESMLPSSAASAAVGEPVSASPSPDVRVRLAGGLACTWQWTGAADTGGVVRLVAVAAALRRGAQDDRLCYSSGGADGEQQQTCTVDAVAGRTWIAGTLTTPAGGTRAATERASSRLEALLVQRGDGGAALPDRPDDAWGLLDCERLGAASSLASVLGRPRLTLGLANGGSEVPRSQVAAWDWTRSTRCLVEDPADESGWGFEVDAYPAGAWLEAQAVEDRARPLEPAVGDARILTSTSFDDAGPSGRRVWVIEGSNAMVIDADGAPLTDAQVRAVAEALLRVLDATR